MIALHLNLYTGGRVYLTSTCGDRHGLFACYDDGCSSFQTDATRPCPPGGMPPGAAASLPDHRPGLLSMSTGATSRRRQAGAQRPRAVQAQFTDQELATIAGTST